MIDISCSQMKPCSVHSVNVARDTFFIAAALSGLQSLNYIANASLSGDQSSSDSRSTKALFLSTIITNVVFVHIGKRIIISSLHICRDDGLLSI